MPSPTPFPAVPGTLTSTPSGAVALTIPELAAAAGFYQDTLLQINGRFNKVPLLVCEGETHRTPATWGLREEGLVIPANGFDEQVRTLLPEDLQMTVEGRWRRWQGVVGCGKQAQPQEIWYLDVSRILSPSPLSQVTLTPPNPEAGTIIAEVPASGATAEFSEAIPTDDGSLEPPSEGDATPLLPEPTTVVEGYPEDAIDLTPSAPPEQTPFPEDATPTLDLLLTPNASSTISVTETIPATPTLSAGSATPAATVIQGTPTQVIDMGDLLNLDEEIGGAVLEAGQTHRWTIETFVDEEIFAIYAFAPAPADLVLSIVKDGQPIVNRQNTAAAGVAEQLAPTALPGPGIYEILVETEGNVPTDYALVANIDLEYPTIFNELLITGTPRSALSLPENAIHYWFFSGNAGSNLTLRVTPADASDPVVDLYGPEAEYLEFLDESGSGEEEVLNLTLPETGLYAVRVSEYRSEPMNYGVEVTLQ